MCLHSLLQVLGLTLPPLHPAAVEGGLPLIELLIQVWRGARV